MAEYTRFGRVAADEFKGPVTGNVTGGMMGAVQLSKGADYALSAAEKKFYVGVTLTAASKTDTLGLAGGQIALVANEGGTNAFTLKNVSGDSGTSLAAGKVALVVASATANASKVTVLN